MLRRVTLEFDSWQEAEQMSDRLVDAGFEPDVQCVKGDPELNGDRAVSCAVLGRRGLDRFIEFIREVIP